MSYLIVNSLGLLLDIAGAVLIFGFALPRKISGLGGDLVFVRRSEEEEQKEAARDKRNDRLAHAGLLCLVGGFSLQLAANLMQLPWADWLPG